MALGLDEKRRRKSQLGAWWVDRKSGKVGDSPEEKKRGKTRKRSKKSRRSGQLGWCKKEGRRKERLGQGKNKPKREMKQVAFSLSIIFLLNNPKREMKLFVLSLSISFLLTLSSFFLCWMMVCR